MGEPRQADAAKVQMLRSLAAAVDAAPQKASLWREYREALGDLMRGAAAGDEALDQALQELRSAAPLGDTEN